MTEERHFHEELRDLKASLLQMSGIVESQVAQALKVMKEFDSAQCKSIRKRDGEVDTLEVQIEERVVSLLARHQPMARDLRLLLAILKISNDLERVGDHAANIARSLKRLKMSPRPEGIDLGDMGRKSADMLSRAIEAFVGGDSQLSRQVCAQDDEVDTLHKSIYRATLDHIRNDQADLETDMEVLLISRNLERIADLATNIGEDNVFLVEGATIKHHWEERDEDE